MVSNNCFGYAVFVELCHRAFNYALICFFVTAVLNNVNNGMTIVIAIVLED